MRRVRLTLEARDRLTEQIDYLISQGAVLSAQALKVRTDTFLRRTLAHYPRTGRFLAEGDLWETWIPGTRLVAWYRFTDDELVVITFWHTAQHRP